MDQAKNFAKATLSGTIDENDTSLTVEAGQGARFPAVPFNAVIYNSTDYPDPSDDPDKEVIRVTAISTDTFTIVRGQESTTGVPHDTGGKTYFIIAGLTARMLNEDLLGDRFGSGTAVIVDTDSEVVTARQSTARYLGLNDTQITIQSTKAFLGDIDGQGNETYIDVDDSLQRVTITKQTVLTGLPTSNPAIAGALWNDGGTVKISAG